MIAWRRAHYLTRSRPRPAITRRWISASALDRSLSEPVQSYISTSHDPYLNLSIEHYFLQKSAPDSAVLFLYVNRPSIIIGRNQNPWLEVNLALLQESSSRPETEPPGLGVVDLVRRRSGGGTVFHDEGNVNWSIICPSAKFTRDKHAEMVVRALRGLGIDRARVNERHDIVLDQGERVGDSELDDTHATPYTKSDGGAPRPLKVAGSAYKLTRGRALHHGTCLLSSPNLNIIPHYLHSPAKPFMTARGVESVSSPVGNILLSNESFSTAVQEQFGRLYDSKSSFEPSEVGVELLEIQDIAKGNDELKSTEWKSLQTPQFTLSNAADDMSNVDVELTARHGVVTGGFVSARNARSPKAGRLELGNGFMDQKLHEIRSWENALAPGLQALASRERASVADWLQQMLPVGTIK